MLDEWLENHRWLMDSNPKHTIGYDWIGKNIKKFKLNKNLQKKNFIKLKFTLYNKEKINKNKKNKINNELREIIIIKKKKKTRTKIGIRKWQENDPTRIHQPANKKEREREIFREKK